jgi:DNA-directed RNA polymerase II subunit RPB1
MSINPTFYSEDVKKIDKIEFSIFRNKDVKLYSAVSGDPFGIDLAESYENYEPKKGGLVDLRLGTCDIYLPCTTCGENSLECPGHFGHTELAEPVFNFGFLNHLKNILQCICLKCSNLLIEKSDSQFKKVLNKKAEARFKELKAQTKNVNYCFQCGIPVPKIKREVKDNGFIKIMIERNINISDDKDESQNVAKKIKESLSPRNCYDILKNVSDNDCYLLGFNPKMQRPEDLIIQKFPIPPVIIRPTAKVDFMSAATMEDSLTLKISDIITSNKRVRQQMEKETISNELSTYNQDIFNLLQYHIATYFDNESVSLPRTEFKTGGRTTKSISDRINGKAGRVRSNLMGKRVDFSARSVITSDPYINIDQVGIPKKIAMELTIPEEVTPYNIKYLTGLVKNGRDVYPGANFVLRINFRDGKPEIQKIDLKYRKKAIRLNFGDIVERHSIDGDHVLFNRQPTLHKPSMMGHKIQVIDNNDLNTFRVNVSVCKPYNADFDGDEMNIHLAQSVQARNELKRIANVQYQIVGVKDSSPIIGCQQDTLSGAYMLTEPSVRINGFDVANILCNTTSDTKFEIKLNKDYTGHELFSHIIPVGINNTKKIDDKIVFQIKNGKLTKGYLDKNSLSFAKNSIIHFIWDKFGPNKTRRFIDDSQRLILNYLLLRGQTVGFNDLLIDKPMEDQIQQLINQKILESKYAITQYENDTDQISLEIIENSLMSELDAMRANIGQMLMSHLKIDNFFWAAAKSGSKGNASNVAQVSGVIGQNNVDGARIKKKIKGRTLVYWHKDDDTPEARGFIKNSYLTGLRGFEFFYNAY